MTTRRSYRIDLPSSPLGGLRLAYVPGDVTLWPNLSGGDVIDLLGRLRGGLNHQRRKVYLNDSTWTRERRAAPIPKVTGRRPG
jgi:ABC-type multidrug transport system ATPase subunit